MRSLVLAMASMAYLSGCFGSPTDFQKQATSGRSGAVGTLATKTKDGVTSATIRADQDSEQILELNDIPELKGSSLSLPPGSLAIAVNVNVQEAAPLATTPNALDLNLGTGFTKAGVPIVIQADKNIDLLKPMTISLPLPSSGQLMLADPFENLVVLELSRFCGVLPVTLPPLLSSSIRNQSGCDSQSKNAV